MLASNTLLQDRYLITRPIGKGGMGAVYQATDTRLDCTVALKQTLLTDKNMRKAFEREAQLLARLRHPTLPKVSDHFAEESGQFLVMEFIPGDDLAGLLSRNGGKFPADDVLTWVVRWADQLLDALIYLHTQSLPIMHQDIKPQNLKLTERGDVILLDFGLAKGALSRMATVTAGSSINIGGFTPDYAPLEQIRGSQPDPRSDLYSLGATLYHLLTGVRPPDALTRAAALLNENADPLRLACEFNPQIPATVTSMLQSALALNIDERPASAAAMREVLRSVKGDSQPYRQATHDNGSGAAVAPVLPQLAGIVAAALPGSSTSGTTTAGNRTDPPLVQLRMSVPPTTPPVGTLLHTLSTGTPVLTVAFSPDGQILAAGGEDHTIGLWQVNDESLVYSLEQHSGNVRSTMFSPDGQLLASGSDDERICMWWVNPGSLAAKQDAWSSHAECVAFSPDGQWLASGGWGGVICLWRVDSNGCLTKESVLTSGFVHSIAFSPDGSTLAAGCYDGAVRLWRIADGLLIRTLEGYANFVLSVAFSPDGQWLAAGGGSPSILMWRMRDGRLLHTLEGHTNFVHTVAFHPDSHTLASGSEDKTVRLWRAQDGALLHTFAEHLSGVMSVAFNPSGQTLASASRDTKIRVRQIA